MSLKRKAVDYVLRHNTAHKRSKIPSPHLEVFPNQQLIAPTHQATGSTTSVPNTSNMSYSNLPESRQRTSAPIKPANAGSNAASSLKPSNSEPLSEAGKVDSALPGSSGKPTKDYFTRKRLAPARPWPIVPTSVTASGPRSSHIEGKNYICVTRKTDTGAYLRRFKDLILKEGYKTLHLSALGAAIPLLTILATSLPSVLPHDPDQIQFEWLTGTVHVQDELIPNDENEDVQYETRDKSNLVVIIRIDGGDDASKTVQRKSKKVSTKRDVNRPSGKRLADPVVPVKPAAKPIVVFQEPDQDDIMDE